MTLLNTADSCCRNYNALLAKFIAGSGLTPVRIVKGHLHNSLFHSRIYPNFFWDRLTPTDLRESFFSTGIIQLFNAVKTVAAGAN